MNRTAITIVIPAYNRLPPLLATLASARAACARLQEPAEIILVDDGSTPPLAECLPSEAVAPPVRLLRQPNQGSIVARLAGLAAAAGEFVLFLDSDDLIGPDKLHHHLHALRTTQADISYDDVGITAPPPSPIRTRSHLPPVGDIAELMLRVQPPPHGPVYRADYLRRALATPILPGMRRSDSVGDVWLYYNLCIHPARLVKVDGPHTLIGEHDEERYSQHWERLGFSALEVMETFLRRCPPPPATRHARRLVGECAFVSWRKLPRDFSPAFRARMLALWRAAPDHPAMRLGGGWFTRVARLLGPVTAGRLFRLRNAPYSRSRTIDDAELARLENAARLDPP
jgi:hypothetical protein